MKKQKSEKQSTKSNNNEKKVWKTVAIAVVVIFVLVIIGGAIKAYYFKSSFIKPTQAQINSATKIAAAKLQSSGGNLSAFQTHVGEKMRKLHEDGSKKMMQVTFYNNATTHTYLVDVNAGEVLLHSETDVYGTWASRKIHEHDDFMFPRK